MEGLRVADASLIVYIHPSKANKIDQAVLRQLSSLLFQFDEAYGGVVLAYSVNVKDKSAKILPGIVPYFEGMVVKLGREFIHVIALGFASAAIAAEDIREEFQYKIKNDEGVFSSRSHKRHVIKVGTMLRFLVKSFDEEVLHISGSLIPSRTGCMRYLYKHSKEYASLHQHATEDSSLYNHTTERASMSKPVEENSHLRNSRKHKDKSVHLDTQGEALGKVSNGAYSSKLEQQHRSKRRRTVDL